MTAINGPASRTGSGVVQASVLIVDDSAPIAHVVRAVATSYGCSARVAMSGAEAVQLLETGHYDVLLVGSPVYVDRDTLLLDVLSRDLKRFARRTVVVTTHIRDAAIAARAAGANVFAVIAKPFDIAVLGDTIVECARNCGANGPTRWIGVAEPAGQPSHARSVEFLDSPAD